MGRIDFFVVQAAQGRGWYMKKVPDADGERTGKDG